jgi:hypothetical protein
VRAEEFVAALREEMPERRVLEDYGLDPTEIEGIYESFLVIGRESAPDSSLPETLRLVTGFDCSRVEIGLIRFLGGCREHERGVQFAWCEADPIVLTDDGTVVMCEGSVDIPCAVDSSRFLDALMRFVRLRSNKSRWMGKCDEATARCAEAAGGASYREFFRIVCSFFQ